MSTPTPSILLPAALAIREAAIRAENSNRSESAAEELLGFVLSYRPAIGEMLEAVDVIREQLDETAESLLMSVLGGEDRKPRKLGLIHIDQSVELDSLARKLQDYRVRLADRDATKRLSVDYDQAYSDCADLVNEGFGEGSFALDPSTLWEAAIKSVRDLSATLQQTPILKD